MGAGETARKPIQRPQTKSARKRIAKKWTECHGILKFRVFRKSLATSTTGWTCPRMADPVNLAYWPPWAVCPSWGIPIGGRATPSCPIGGSSGVRGWSPHPASRTWRAPAVLGTLERVSMYWSYLGVWARPQERSIYSQSLLVPLWRADQRGTSKIVRYRFGVSGSRVPSHMNGFGRGEHCGRLGRWRFPNPFSPYS